MKNGGFFLNLRLYPHPSPPPPLHYEKVSPFSVFLVLEGRMNSYSLLYYTHLLISLPGNSTVVLMLSVKHSTPTLNKVYIILGGPAGAMRPGEILIATAAF